MSDCLFCEIIKGNIPSSKVFENDKVYAFKDINPLAKEHYLFIHKNHSKDLLDLTQQDPQQLLDIFLAIQEFLKDSDLSQNGFRIVNNMGKDGGQTVFHTHFHLLGGEQLRGFGA